MNASQPTESMERITILVVSDHLRTLNPEGRKKGSICLSQPTKPAVVDLQYFNNVEGVESVRLHFVVDESQMEIILEIWDDPDQLVEFGIIRVPKHQTQTPKPTA